MSYIDPEFSIFSKVLGRLVPSVAVHSMCQDSSYMFFKDHLLSTYNHTPRPPCALDQYIDK